MSRLLHISYPSPPQNHSDVWQRLQANSISACFSGWKQYSRGLWVSSSFTFNCKVLIKGVGNLGVGLLRDCRKLCNWTQRSFRLKHHPSKAVLRSGNFLERFNVRIALHLQRVRHCQHSLFPRLNTVIAPTARGKLDGTNCTQPATHRHHLHTLPCTTNPSRAEESCGYAKAKVKAWVCGMVNLFSGEVSNWLFNPDRYTHMK